MKIIAPRKKLWLISCFLFAWPLFAQKNNFILIGSDGGLTGFDYQGNPVLFREAGAVRKITHAQGVWAILAGDGIFVSTDMHNWERRVGSLPEKTIKFFYNGKKTFLPVLQDIKDLKIHPENANIMVCATKDAVYLSRDQGRKWTSLGAPQYRTNGIKAVAAAMLPINGVSTLTVFLTHSVYGLYYIHPDLPKSGWTELSNGLEKLETTNNADEVSDIAVIPGREIYTSQTFRRRIYRLDWNKKLHIPLWSDNASQFGTVDSLAAGSDSIRFVMDGGIAEIDSGGKMRTRSDLLAGIRSIKIKTKPRCAALFDSLRRNELVILNELWLIDSDPGNYPKTVEGKEGLYLPVNHALDSNRLETYFQLFESRKLNMVVIDMKDDYGRLRFTPNNPAITEKGRVVRPVDIDSLLANFKKRGIYAIARIVVFKDPALAAKENNKYAVWDKSNNRQWQGYFDRTQNMGTGIPKDSNYEHFILKSSEPGKEILRTMYDEHWVDPYCEEVWDYNAAVASELYERGFNEIQFDYIRFPTDGDNLYNARYRWQENNMDMESAILSFLCHIRTNVKAPISIDIYGANGWYRTGARTGQEVELLAPWVNAISPMFYPSHFEQDFLAQSPADMRPWRIYYLGTMRTRQISRGQIVVRPYVQAFYLNVSYDRKYYNAEYIRKEIVGVHDAGNPGFIYWNNGGRYEDIPRPQDF
jgi:hypothetical protein